MLPRTWLRLEGLSATDNSHQTVSSVAGKWQNVDSNWERLTLNVSFGGGSSAER
jgi:hypothetical protein